MAHCPKPKRKLASELMEAFDPKHLKVGWKFRYTTSSPNERLMRAASRLAAANVPIACPCGGVGFWFEQDNPLGVIRRVLCPVHKEQAKLNLVGMVRVRTAWSG